MQHVCSSFKTEELQSLQRFHFCFRCLNTDDIETYRDPGTTLLSLRTSATWRLRLSSKLCRTPFVKSGAVRVLRFQPLKPWTLQISNFLYQAKVPKSLTVEQILLGGVFEAFSTTCSIWPWGRGLSLVKNAGAEAARAAIQMVWSSRFIETLWPGTCWLKTQDEHEAQITCSGSSFCLRFVFRKGVWACPQNWN